MGSRNIVRIEDGEDWWEEEDLIDRMGVCIGLEEEQGFH